MHILRLVIPAIALLALTIVPSVFLNYRGENEKHNLILVSIAIVCFSFLSHGFYFYYKRNQTFFLKLSSIMALFTSILLLTSLVLQAAQLFFPG